jgi:Flp pilus assembly protein TadG
MMPRPRRGISLIYCTMIMTALFAITSLAVDLGRVQLAKTEMRRAATAAARASASGLSTSLANVQAIAQAYAQYNTIDGGTIAFDPSTDVAVGTWNSTTKTFTAGSFSTATAVQVTLRRTSATSNAIPLVFAKVIGKSSFDLTVSSVATAATTAGSPANPTPAFVGLANFSASGITTDSYNATLGSYASQSHTAKGSFGSNNNISAWSCTVNGDAHPGPGKTEQGGSISGSTTPLPSTFSYTIPAAPTSNSNANIAISGGGIYSGDLDIYGSATLPGGTYVFGNINNSGTLNFTGPATVYISGQISNSGTINTYQSLPSNLTLIIGSGVYLNQSTPIYADIFSPTAQFSCSGFTLYGQIIVHDFYASGMTLHYDTSLPTHNPTGGGFSTSGSSGSTTIGFGQ